MVLVSVDILFTFHNLDIELMLAKVKSKTVFLFQKNFISFKSKNTLLSLYIRVHVVINTLTVIDARRCVKVV